MPEFTHQPERHRYEAAQDGEVVGTIDYELDGSTLTITHTITDPKASGQGVAAALTRYVLDDARARQLKVVPVWSYAAAFFDKHPEYADLR